MRAVINREHPAHGIVGEEFGNEREDAEHVWVLDPIDGTRSFISGLPTWGTLIGLMRDGKPILGMMAQPFTGERFAGDTARAWYTGPGGARAIKTRPCRALGDASLFTTTPALFKGDDRAAYDRVEAAVRMPRYGYDCYAYCMVAAGNTDVVVEAGLQPYDIVALIPIIEGAGGRVTDWDGGSAANGGRVVASGDRRLHEQVLAKLRG
jgi:myo-inositol-1(or 4)-monophosphatase